MSLEPSPEVVVNSLQRSCAKVRLINDKGISGLSLRGHHFLLFSLSVPLVHQTSQPSLIHVRSFRHTYLIHLVATMNLKLCISFLVFVSASLAIGDGGSSQFDSRQYTNPDPGNDPFNFFGYVPAIRYTIMAMSTCQVYLIFHTLILTTKMTSCLLLDRRIVHVHDDSLPRLLHASDACC